MKKILTAAVCACMLFGAGAHADILKSGSSVTVSYEKLSEKPFDLLVYIFKPGTDLSDGKIDNADMQKLFYMEQRKSAAEFSDTLTFNENDDEGIYYVVRGGFEEDVPLGDRMESFAYLKANTEKEIVARLNSAADYSALKTVMETYDGFAWIIDKDNEIYKKYSGIFYKTFFDNFGGSFTDTGDAEKFFEKTCIILNIDSLKGSELTAAIGKLELTDDEFYKNNSRAVTEVYEKYTDKGKSIKELQKTLAEAVAVTDVNMSDSENVLAAVKRYPEIFSVSFDGEFKNVSEAQMARALYHKNFVRANEVDAAFNAQLKALSNGSGSGSGSGGGSSGGKSSGGTSFSPAASSNIDSDFMSSLSDKRIFNDIDQCEWARDYIESVYRRQIMIGSDGYFRPNDYLKREELVKIAVLAKELDTNTDEVKHFDDVAKDDWFYPYIQTAVSNGIVNGIDDTVFGTGRNVSRQEAAAMLYRAFGAEESEETAYTPFADHDEISDYALNAVNYLAANNVLSGFTDNTFRPHDMLTRAQAAKIICELLRQGG